MAVSYSQPFPAPSSPICDPATGRVADVWLQFFMSQFARTGGAVGPAADAGTAAQMASDAARLALFSDVAEPAPSLAFALAAIADLQALAVLHDAADAPSPDQAALLALVLAD